MDINIIVKEFKAGLDKIYDKRLKHVILYGSWARGEATADSDIDILVVLEGEVRPGHEIDTMIDIITDINLKYGALLNVHPISEQDYKDVQSPILVNVRKEGLSV